MLTFEIINSTGRLNEISEDWDILVSAQKYPNVFLDFTWIETWWQHFGIRKNLWVVSVRQSGTLVGIAPLFFHSRYTIKTLQFIGRPGSDYSDILIHPDHPECVEKLWQFVLDNCEGSVLHLEGISQESPSNNFFKNNSASLKHGIRRNIIYNSPFIDIAHDWTHYKTSIKKRLLQDTSRQIRRLNVISELVFTNISDSDEINKLLRQMIEQKIQRYKSTGAKNIFRDGRYEAFYKSISQKFLAKGYLDFSHIKLGSELLAIHFGFIYREKFFYYMPSFNLDYSNYSPSRILLYKLIQQSFFNQYSEFDFLSGDESYKYDWTDSYRQISRIFMYPNTIKGKLLALLYTCAIPSIKQSTITKKVMKTIRKY